MKKIAILASGSGTNAERIIRHFSGSAQAVVEVVMSNRADALVLERAKGLGVDALVFSRSDLYDSGKVADELRQRRIDGVVLAGFLWLVPDNILTAYPDRILNIHPALLPKYGGKGMYGDRVHRAVIQAGETESGITIHRVNRHYDSGDILFQARIPVEKDDTPETLAARIHELEYRHYPEIIERELLRW